MRIIRVVFLLGAYLIAAAVQAEEGEFDIGIAAISPNGITAKFWTSDRAAIDIFGEWSFNSDEYHAHADLLYHDFDKIQLEDMRIAFYYGGGVRAIFAENEDTVLGVRIPFGLDYFLNDMPLEFFGELAPRVNIYPDTHFGMDVIVGLRYRFI
ncbi:MAG: hypothetical protein L0Z73_17760 [Gammaproteobacteria bacterium]|nr:hypothetical protein [Gammaproteobacteria bacterium]